MCESTSVFQPEIPKSVTVVKSAKGGRGGVPGGSGDKDFISYTVSVPSGRGSAVFSVDGEPVINIVLMLKHNICVFTCNSLKSCNPV